MRTGRSGTRTAGTFVVLVTTVAGLLASLSTSVPSASAAGSPSKVYVTGMRDICHLPPSGNNARALGADVGWSFASAGHIYWLFGDTFTDRNGDGLPGAGDFQTGTIARSDDHDASDCVDMTFRTDAQGYAAPALRPHTAENECLTWPGGGIDVAGTPYFYYTSVRETTPCGTSPTPQVQYAKGLAKITDPIAMTTARVGIMWPAGSLQYANPISIGGYLYVFATIRVNPSVWYDGTTNVYVAKVLAGNIERIASYSYWNGSTWDPTATHARPIFQDMTPGYDGVPSIAYQPKLGRFLAVYTCGFLNSAVCARTASTSGSSGDAITQGWNDPKVLYQCPGYSRCQHAFQHAEYASSSVPGRIYLTVARNYPDGQGKTRYWVTLRAFDLDTVPAPASRSIFEPETDFASTQNAKGWTYRSGDMSVLTWHPTTKVWTNSDADPPVIRDDGATPGALRGAVRMWVAWTAGDLQISGEVWLEAICGDGAGFEIRQVNGLGSTSILPTVALAPTWSTGHADTFVVRTHVVAGDQIWLRTGSRGLGSTACDAETYLTSLVFDHS